MRGKSSRCSGGAKNRFGPAHSTGAARCSHTGSISTRVPSISTSEEECPIHVTRRPLTGGSSNKRASVRKGPRGCFGTRSSRSVRYRPRTLTIVDHPPTDVGTGLIYCLPFRCALPIVVMRECTFRDRYGSLPLAAFRGSSGFLLRAGTFRACRGTETHSLDVVCVPADTRFGLEWYGAALGSLRDRGGQGLPCSSASGQPAARVYSPGNRCLRPGHRRHLRLSRRSEVSLLRHPVRACS